MNKDALKNVKGAEQTAPFTHTAPTLNEYEVAEDMLIDGLKIVQDTRFYRFTSDSVLLSKFARAKAGDKVADFCSGSGIVAYHFYALNKDVPRLSFTLFELQEELCAISEKTAQYNGFTNFTIVQGRVQDIPKTYDGAFSLVLCNPPYERGGIGKEDYKKAICRKEITVTLKEICLSASRCLKYGGRFVLVNRADRVSEVLYTMHEAGMEPKRLQFVLGKEGAEPYLVMVEAVKGGKPATTVLPTLVNEK